MPNSRTIVLASNNQGKIKEFNHILGALDLQVRPQSKFGVSEADEPFFTFVENALAKARHAAAATGLPALADDSGICVNALGGAPGVHSARFAGEPKSDARNSEHLLKQLAPHADKSAYYYCVLVYVRSAQDPQPIIADGVLRGEIITEARGSNGFGYDPHFWIPSLQMTAAELSPEQKHQISHRGQAMRALLAALR
jgi:XTP/dITP diphosphohydrolase